MKQKLIDLVAGIKPHDSLEQQHIDDTISWIQSGEPIYRISKPDNPDKHLVSYFMMFDQDEQKILLVDHKKAGLWLPAGGHVEIDEDPADAAARECMEELFVRAEFWVQQPIFLTQTVTVGKTAGHIDVSLWYLIKGKAHQEYQYDPEEFSAIKWFGLDELPYEYSDPHMKRFISKLKEHEIGSKGYGR